MVVLLVLATCIVFITIDFLLHREKYAFKVAEDKPVAEPTERAMPGPIVAGVHLPEAPAYHVGHTWALDLGHGRMRVGLDAFAASLLGTIRRIEVPLRGRWLRQGDRGWTVATAHGDVQMLAPVEGEIVTVNEAALRNPEIVTADPYGQGWLAELFSPDVPVSFRNLLSRAFARRWMEESMAELRAAFSPTVPVTALDGGTLLPRVGDELTPEQWRELVLRFFRSWEGW